MRNGKQGKYTSPARAIVTGLKDLLRKKTRVGEVRDVDRLDGKNVLITGANSGLGYAIALQLAKKGAGIYMACRGGIPEKGEKIKKAAGSADVHMFSVDLSDLNSIETLIKNLIDRKIKFDIIICNAAMVPRKSRKTGLGLEEMFAVNYLSKYLMVRRLIEHGCIRTNPARPARIIFISSESHRNPENFEWDKFGLFQDYGMAKTVERYGYYKLMLTTLACELSRRLNGFGISVFALCPGPVNSRIAREAPWLLQPILKLVFSIFFRSPMQAAEPAVYFAVSPDVTGRNFDYLHLMSRKEIDQKASDPDNGRKLWDLSEQLLEKHHILFRPDQKSDML
jgi:NAD(P)-dependent dehydrogenase (short-subunit alcohol dehydrogenase family)